MQARDPEDQAPSVTIGEGRAILSDRISHFLNIRGPSWTLDTACSGSLVAVDVACRYLQTGEIDGAVVAAANLYLSLSGKCHTFDVKADGYNKGEAVNAVILKRLDDSIRDGDPIRAVIRGTATNSDGRTPGIASPDSKAQATAIRAAYANAGISDLIQTTYLECHGTGTQAGDPTEVAGVSSVFADSRIPSKPLIIGSIKSNIGHSEPAAGISGLLKAILTLEHDIIPGNPTFVTPNPNIDFHALKVHATRTAKPWPKAEITRVGVNSFGYGASNAHVVLDDPKSLVSGDTIRSVSSYVAQEDGFFPDDEVSARPYILVFSANDDKSLQDYTKTMRSHLVNPAVSVKLRDLSYTLSERRTHRFQRAYAVVYKTSLDESSLVFGKKSPEAPRIGFVFTELVENFPAAALLLKHLDDVLQTSPIPPTWRLQSELTESRSPELLRQPEFSQPVCTALQLAILAVLEDWDIRPQAVVVHSSGEIAAAYAAGYLTREDAIKAAYYRGQAAKLCNGRDDTPVGMLAAGLGPAQIIRYIQPHQGDLYIACFNSPSSVTISGKTSKLEAVKCELLKDSHFARLLQVDVAYHSRFMDEIGSDYVDLLSKDLKPAVTKSGNTEMFSSVTGLKMQGMADNFLIEIGPSAALSALVTQIAKAMPFQATSLQYYSRKKPSVIIDLPNYAWNHSTAYWYENESSKDWRYRIFPHHNLLGSKVLGTTWHAPSWKKSLRIQDLSWLKDHRIGDDIVFPTIDFMAIAIKAISQTSQALSILEGEPKPGQARYRLRDVTFPKALVLDDNSDDRKIILSLNKVTSGSWYEFKVTSLTGDAWLENSRGLVRVENEVENVAPKTALAPLAYAIPGQSWYKAMHDAGYSFGPLFQKHLEIESTSGSRESRSIISLTSPASEYPQSLYPLHPTSINGCLQSCTPSLWAGDRTSISAVLIPSIINEVIVSSNNKIPDKATSVTASQYVGIGREEETKNYMSNAFVIISEIVNLVLYKRPNAKIIEFNTVHGYLNSIWLDGSVLDRLIRAACREFYFTSNDATALLVTQEKYGTTANVIYGMLDFRRNPEDFETDGTDFDFAIMRVPNRSAPSYLNAIKNTRSILSDDSHLIPMAGLDSEIGAVLVKNDELQVYQTKNIDKMSHTLATSGFVFTRSVPFDCTESLEAGYLFVAKSGATSARSEAQSLEVIHLATPSKAFVDLIYKLQDHGWQISEHDSCLDFPKKSTVLIADELSSPSLPTIDATQWRILHNLVASGSKILWLTSGSQLSVTNPNAAMIYGFARTLRNEDPALNFKVLDVESSFGPATSIAEEDDMNGADPVSTVLHDLQTTVRMRAECLGTLESLCFAEVDSEELPLKDGCVEVELFAAGLNFKDVAITMGIVPENQYLLGLEGAGTIRRVGKTAANSYKIGDRVLVFEKRAFGNRIIATTERTYHIPDWMSYEEASTLPSVYLTALYSIHDLASAQKGDRVLIYSATGGLGLTSIQILQHIGAEVFVTVGNDEKRKFLNENYGISADHIFNSRNTEFAPKLMSLTNGEGVNVILSSPTGDILDKSWRYIANGGTMVEPRKKDMLDRNLLSMEPFGRNASYRCFDMSYKYVSDALIARLLD
ncbi:hypothetical protein BDR22DRAFT_827160 [Usnea florida]